MIPVRDVPPVYGMNTVDDPKRLRKGECVRLLNMFPGSPPLPRNGCPGVYKSNIDSTDEFVPPVIIFGFRGDTEFYAIAWIYNETTNRYCLTNLRIGNTDVIRDNPIYQIGVAEVTEPIFGLISIHSNIYCFINKSLTSWQSDTKALSHKVIESNLIVRDMCISEAAQVDSVSTGTGGSLTNGKYVEYAFQYVRRNDTAAFTAGTTPSGMILPVGVSDTPQRINTFLPGMCVGIEDSTKRKVLTIDKVNAKGVIDISSTAADASHAIAIAQGATHLRVSRGREASSAALAQASTKFFLCDLPLGTGTSSFDDTTSDAALAGETNQLLTGYSVAPAGSFAKYHLGRMFLMNDNGMVYYSETVGGDGAYDSDLSQTYPQAWSSLFKPVSYFIDCDSKDGLKASGIESLESDLYFFKESKIFALYGGNPSSTTVTILSETMGCPLPHTIKKMEITGKGTMIFFISNNGPAFLSAGGRIQLFSDFKIKELWPYLSRSIIGQIEDHNYFIKNNCTAIFYKNTIWIFYRTALGSKKIYGFYFSPTDENARGPMEIELARETIFGAIVAVDNINIKAYVFGKYTDYLVVTEFLQDYLYEDIDTLEEYSKTNIISDKSDIISDGGDHVID